MAVAGPHPIKEMSFEEVSNLILTHMEDKHFSIDMTFLHFAALKGWVHCFPALLKNGMRPSDKDSSGNSAIDYAEKNGHKAAANLLLGKPAEEPLTEATEHFYKTHRLKSLTQAITERNILIALELIEKKPQLNDLLQRLNNKNVNPLELAINQQLPDVVKALVSAGCNITDVSNKTSALLLPDATKPDILNAILEGIDLYTAKSKISNKKAILNIRDQEGETALYNAVLMGSLPNVNLLLKHGADPHIANNDCVTPFQLALSMSAMDNKGNVWEKILKVFEDNQKLSASVDNSASSISVSSSCSSSSSALCSSSSSAFTPYSQLMYSEAFEQPKTRSKIQKQRSDYPIVEAKKVEFNLNQLVVDTIRSIKKDSEILELLIQSFCDSLIDNQVDPFETQGLNVDAGDDFYLTHLKKAAVKNKLLFVYHFLNNQHLIPNVVNQLIVEYSADSAELAAEAFAPKKV